MYFVSGLDYSCAPRLLWTQSGLKVGMNVTWTTENNLAVVDFNTHTVTLWSQEGHFITDTKSHHIKLESPIGIVCHKGMYNGVLIVCEEGTCKLVVIKQDCTQTLSEISLEEHLSLLQNVTVLSNDNLALCGVVYTSSGSSQVESPGVVVVSTSGDLQHKWNLTETEGIPHYIHPTADNCILVSTLFAGKLCKMTLTGDLLWSTSESITPGSYGMTVDLHGNILLCCKGTDCCHVRVLSSSGQLLQSQLLPAKTNTTQTTTSSTTTDNWDGLESLSLQGEHLAVIHWDKLELYKLTPHTG